MSTPGVWAQEDLDKILSVYGVFMYATPLVFPGKMVLPKTVL